MNQPTPEQQKKFAKVFELCQRADQQMQKADKTLERIEQKVNQQIPKQTT